MDPHRESEVDYEFLPNFRAYKDGHIERLLLTETVPPSFDPHTNVTSKDILIVPEANLSARLYLRKQIHPHQKLPLLVYYHGGSFCVGSRATPMYHNFLNSLVAKANVVAVSVDYRQVPEHPLPIAYEDSWAALKWVMSHSQGQGSEAWLMEFADFGKLFLAGDSAGGNIAHNMAMFAGDRRVSLGVKIVGICLIHPYFWGSKAIGSESTYPHLRAIGDSIWPRLCPSAPSNDNPRVNPMADDAPDLSGLSCERVLIFVAEKDILKDRGRLYCEILTRSDWKGVAEIAETKGEGHAFHLDQPTTQKAADIINRMAGFLTRENPLLLNKGIMSHL